MQAFSSAGIYVFVDLDTFNTQIEQTNPEWSYSQYQAFTAVIDAFAGYDNIAGFFVANEVPPCQEAIDIGRDHTEWNGRCSVCESCCS